MIIVSLILQLSRLLYFVKFSEMAWLFKEMCLSIDVGNNICMLIVITYYLIVTIHGSSFLILSENVYGIFKLLGISVIFMPLITGILQLCFNQINLMKIINDTWQSNMESSKF